VLLKDPNQAQNYLQNTQYQNQNARVGGTSLRRTVPAARARSTSSVGGPCTSSATKRRRRENLRLVVPVFVTISTPSLARDILAFPTMPTRTVPGVPQVATNVPRTRSPGLTQRLAADALIARIRTTAKASRGTASTLLPVMITLNANSRRRSVGTSLTGNVNAMEGSKEMVSNAWMEMAP